MNERPNQRWQRRDVLKTLGALAATGSVGATSARDADSEFRIASFRCDVTCPVGHPLLGGIYPAAASISDPLFAHGFVLLSGDAPIVFCTVDWCEIRNQSYDLWREELAKAARTTRDRVLLASVHQHDAPLTDIGAARHLEAAGLSGAMFDLDFEVDCIRRTSQALSDSLRASRPLTHIGTGEATVNQVASNRRIVGPDGVGVYSRASKVGNRTDLMDAPEGQIDPKLKMVSFWSDDEPLVAFSSYACHPMSYYGQGEVSADFVGRARAIWQAKNANLHHIYACGCSGDIVAGKYNSGSHENRPVLAHRLATAMQNAWENTSKQELNTLKLESAPLRFSFRESADYSEAALLATLKDSSLPNKERILAAMGLASRDRVKSNQPIDFCALDFGQAKIVMPSAEVDLIRPLSTPPKRRTRSSEPWALAALASAATTIIAASTAAAHCVRKMFG